MADRRGLVGHSQWFTCGLRSRSPNLVRARPPKTATLPLPPPELGASALAFTNTRKKKIVSIVTAYRIQDSDQGPIPLQLLTTKQTMKLVTNSALLGALLAPQVAAWGSMSLCTVISFIGPTFNC